MPVAGGPKLTTTGILLEVDAADRTSYSGTGTTWTNQVRPGTFNGTLNNISFNSTDAKGALVFTGSNTFVDFGNLGPSLTSSFSFQIAFKPAATASGQPYTILSYASSSATSSITFKLDYTSSNQTVVLTTFAGTGSQNIVYALSASVSSGSWNIVHGTYGAQLAALYVNGLNISTANTTGSVVGYNSSNRLYAGASFGITSSFFTGSIANIIINNADLNFSTINRNYNAISSRFGLRNVRSIITDLDALAFIISADIENLSQQIAVENLVLGLKSNNLWTKMVAVYPFVGGNASTHKYNLKDPRDTDSAYRILWSGGIIHNTKGVTFNGTSYGDTRFEPFQALTNPTQSSHVSIYISGSVPNITTGVIGNSPFANTGLSISMGVQNRMTAYSVINSVITVDGPTGLAAVTRTGQNSSAAYLRGSVTRTYTSTDSPTPGSINNIWIGKMNTSDWSGATGTTAFGFVSLGTGLTSTDIENLYTVVHAYNTTLNRAFNQ